MHQGVIFGNQGAKEMIRGWQGQKPLSPLGRHQSLLEWEWLMAGTTRPAAGEPGKHSAADRGAVRVRRPSSLPLWPTIGQTY